MVLGAVIIILAAAVFIPVFGTAEGDDFYLRYKDKNIYVLNYEQTTGAGYTVKNTKDEKLFGKSVAVKTPDVTIKVSPQRMDLVQIQLVEGRRCIVIPMEDGVQINGMNVTMEGTNGTD